MTPFNHSDRLRRFSKAMAMLTTLGMLLIAVAMILVFLIPDWTRNLLLGATGPGRARSVIVPGAPDRRLPPSPPFRSVCCCSGFGRSARSS